MKSKRAVLDVVFPAVRARLMRLLFALPLRPYYGRELAVRSGLALHTVQDELRKLTAVGLLTSSSNGNRRFFRANRDHPLYSHFLRIVELSEALPKTKQSALGRPCRGKASKSRTKRKPRGLAPERPLSMHLFSKQRT